MYRWDRTLDQYIQECEQRGLMASTVFQRRRELERVGCWLKRRRPKVDLENVGADLLIRYIQSRTTFCSKSTVCSVVTQLRGMGDFLTRQGMWLKNPMRWIRGPKLDGRQKLPRRISKLHMRKLWDAAETDRNVFIRYRSLCLLSLLYGTGLRRGELERLNVESWDREASTLTIDGRKTGQERKVPVGKGVWRCMEAYLPYRHNILEQRGDIDEPALFLNKSCSRSGGESISRIVHRLARRADVPLVSLHQFRHSCASDLLEQGVPLPQIQQVLGHAYIASTMRYTAVADPQRHIAQQSHPINDFLNATKEGSTK